MNSPTKHQFGAAKNVSGTLDYGIWYPQVLEFKLFGFTEVIRQAVWMIEGALQVLFSLLGLEPSHGVQRNKL